MSTLREYKVWLPRSPFLEERIQSFVELHRLALFYATQRRLRGDRAGCAQALTNAGHYRFVIDLWRREQRQDPRSGQG